MTAKWLLTDDEARDVSRVTGIPWYYGRIHQRGPLHPLMDLSELDWWDRFRVAWVLVAGYGLIHHDKTPVATSAR